MRVNPITVSAYPKHVKRNIIIKPDGDDVVNIDAPTFKGGLKLPDYIAGGVCGTALGVVVSAALCPPLGILAGIFGAKAVAEANRDSRPSKPDD